MAAAVSEGVRGVLNGDYSSGPCVRLPGSGVWKQHFTMAVGMGTRSQRFTRDSTSPRFSANASVLRGRAHVSMSRPATRAGSRG